MSTRDGKNIANILFHVWGMSTRDGKNIANILFHVWGVGGGGNKMHQGGQGELSRFLKIRGEGYLGNSYNN